MHSYRRTLFAGLAVSALILSPGACALHADHAHDGEPRQEGEHAHDHGDGGDHARGRHSHPHGHDEHDERDEHDAHEHGHGHGHGHEHEHEHGGHGHGHGHSEVGRAEFGSLSDPRARAQVARAAMQRLHEARANGRHEDLHAAEDGFRAVLAAGDDSLEVRTGLAYSLIGQHRFREALAEARRAADSRPDDLRAWALLGDAHFALGNYAEAELVFERLEAEELTLGSLSRLAQVRELRGDRDEARRLYGEALQAAELLDEPDTSRAWCQVMLGELSLEEGDVASAREAYERALELAPQAPSARFGLARCSRVEGDHAAAAATLESLVATHPSPRHWIALGDALASAGRGDQAARWWGEAERDLTHDLDHGDLGHLREHALLELRLGDPETAVELARRDRDDVRADSGTHETLGWALLAAGRANDAVASMRDALRPGPSSVRLLVRAALAFEAAGDTAEAKYLLESAAARRPELSRDALLALAESE